MKSDNPVRRPTEEESTVEMLASLGIISRGTNPHYEQVRQAARAKLVREIVAWLEDLPIQLMNEHPVFNSIGALASIGRVLARRVERKWGEKR